MNNNLIKYLSELGMYRRATRLGPKLAGLPFEEYLASHVVRASQLAYILAELEGANPEKTACIVLFHDNGELRVGDQTKVSARYVDVSEGKRKAIEEQLQNLPATIANRVEGYYAQFEKRNTKEGIIAKDADWLEVAIFAKEMVELGFKGMQNWIDNVRAALETNSAKEILKLVETETDFGNLWWQGLKKMTYQKIKNDK